MSMVRVPRGLHRQASRRGPKLGWGPGVGGSGMQPIRRTTILAYQQPITSVPLTGGQGQAVIPGSGTVTVAVGPQGLGNIWYPVSVTISTTSGPLDTSTCKVYLGAQGIPITLQGTLFPGGVGTVALAIPSMAAGQQIIATWTGAKPGDLAAINIVGQMTALAS